MVESTETKRPWMNIMCVCWEHESQSETPKHLPVLRLSTYGWGDVPSLIYFFYWDVYIKTHQSITKKVKEYSIREKINYKLNFCLIKFLYLGKMHGANGSSFLQISNLGFTVAYRHFATNNCKLKISLYSSSKEFWPTHFLSI